LEFAQPDISKIVTRRVAIWLLLYSPKEAASTVKLPEEIHWNCRDLCHCSSVQFQGSSCLSEIVSQLSASAVSCYLHNRQETALSQAKPTTPAVTESSSKPELHSLHFARPRGPTVSWRAGEAQSISLLNPFVDLKRVALAAHVPHQFQYSLPPLGFLTGTHCRIETDCCPQV